MKYRTVILLLCLSVVRCDKNRIQKRSYYHHPGSFNELSYHTPGVVPLGANPFLFKTHHDPGFIKPFGLTPQHVLPAPAPVFPQKFFPGDAWVTQYSATLPRAHVLPAPVVPTAPFVPAAPSFVPNLLPAPAIKPLAFSPPVSYVPVSPIPKPGFVPIPRPVIAQPAFVPTAVHPVAVRPIVAVLPPPHHHHHHEQPTVSSENPENPPINIPDEQGHIMPEIDETESPHDQSTHTPNIHPTGLPPAFVMQIGTSGSGISATSSPFAPPSQPSRPPPSTFAFGGMVPQVMPVFVQMMHHPHSEPNNFQPHHITPPSYGPPPHYGPPRNHHLRSQKLRRKPYRHHHRKPHRHPKKLRYTIIKHHHDRK